MAGGNEFRPQHTVCEDTMHRRCDRRSGLVTEQDSGTAEGVGHGSRCVGDDRKAMVHRLEEGKAEALVIGQADENVRCRVCRRELRIARRTGDHDRVTESE